MKKEILVIICIAISVLLVVSGVLRGVAVNSIGGHYFKPNSLTEKMSLIIWISGIVIDIFLIISTLKLNR